MPNLLCTVTPLAAKKRVEDLKQTLMSWTDEVKELRTQFSWLLFFSVPKLLRLYYLLTKERETSEHFQRIVHEISFLCANSVETRSQMNTQVKVCL